MGMILGGMYFKANGQIRTAKTNGMGDPGKLKPDLLYSGMVGKIKLGETAVVGDLVYPESVNQEFMLADPTTGAIKGPANAILLQGGGNGEWVLALFEGYMKYDTWATTEYMASKARDEFTIADGGLDNELWTMGETIIGLDVATEDGIVAGSTDVIYMADSDIATFEAAITMAILDAILLANGSLIEGEVDWTGGHKLALVAVEAGIAGNAIIATDGMTGASAWDAATFLGGTDAGPVYCGDAGKPACLAAVPATGGDMVQVIGYSLSPSELMFKPITDYDTV